MASRKHKSGGVKMITAAMNHRRSDKYLFANAKEYRCVSYRTLWHASGMRQSFEAWLSSNGILTA